MKNLIIRTSLYIAIALVPISCGTRKVDSNKQNTIDNTIESLSSVITLEKKDTSLDRSKEVESANSLNKKQEFRITELYRENGSLQSRIRELINSSDSLATSKEVTKERWFHSVFTAQYTTTIFRTRTIKTHSDIYHSERKGGSTLANIAGMILLGIGCFLVGKYFDPTIKLFVNKLLLLSKA